MQTIKFPCYPDCVVYPSCKSKIHISCPTLQWFWARHFISNGNHERKAWESIKDLFPNLITFSGGNPAKYNVYANPWGRT